MEPGMEPGIEPGMEPGMEPGGPQGGTSPAWDGQEGAQLLKPRSPTPGSDAALPGEACFAPCVTESFEQRKSHSESRERNYLQLFCFDIPAVKAEH